MARGSAARVLLVLAFLSGPAFAGSAGFLPVYIEDSHAGTYYWVLRNLPFSRAYQLVLIDAHSDASGILDSDAVRDAALRAATEGRLAQLVGAWRANGRIQCFNWVEPLIPNPISKVWWVPSQTLTATQAARMRRLAAQQIDAHESAWPRRDGDFGDRYEVLALDRLAKQKFSGPLVVTLDLDYLRTATSASAAHAQVERLLDIILKLPRMQALTISISRAHLVSGAQADLLLLEVFRYLTRVMNADIHFEPFLSAGQDRSEMAKKLYRQRRHVPQFDIEAASPFLQTAILQNRSRIHVAAERAHWEALLYRWRSTSSAPRLVLSVNGRPDRSRQHALIPASSPFHLSIENARELLSTDIRWKAIVAANMEYNLTGQKQGFADGAPRYLRYRDVPLEAANGMKEVDGGLLIPFLDWKTGLGALRIYCEAGSGANTRVSNIISFSRFQGEGYVGKLTEIFNLPYVYGSALIHIGGSTSADARYGADCSSFIIYGRRREGGAVPYADPKDLLPYLEERDEILGFRGGIAWGAHGEIRLSPDNLRSGLLLHFGKHIAAVYADPGATGVLGAGTPVVHQLGGVPEITSLGVLAARHTRIRVMVWRAQRSLAHRVR